MTAGRNIAILVGAAALSGLVALYALVDPAEAAWMPKCMVHTLTGFDCPGCGSQRAIHALLHGNFREAFEANAFLLCLIPLLALMAFAELNRKRFPVLYRRISHPVLIFGILFLTGVWTVWRNL